MYCSSPTLYGCYTLRVDNFAVQTGRSTIDPGAW